MPPQLQQLLENRRLLLIIGIGLAVLVVIMIIVGVMGGGGGKKDSLGSRKLNDNEKVLGTIDNMGKAIEIQAMMARQKITLLREDAEGGKFTLKFPDDTTSDDRDRALVTLVQSGLMDKNVGLEVFDKGDLTASREEKRIKLVRARNGELARLIRKIPPIQDASVFISMPEPSIFKRDQTPISATVQVTLTPGERLDRDKVRSVINLLVGSLENLDASHVSLSDTNGIVYNSVLSASDELMDKLEERDRYMEQKVKSQLDRLVGAGKYAVTVSTYLRETTKEEMTLNYDPQESSVMKSSSFKENLNAQQRNSGQAGGPTSSYLPPGVDAVSGGDSSGSQRGYNRNGQEFEYNSGKKQTTESSMPGMMEEITMAVTLDGGTFPANMTQEDFKTLVARAASPLAKPENVTIATGKLDETKPLNPSVNTSGNGEDSGSGGLFGFGSFGGGRHGMPWWVWAGIGSIAFLFFLILLKVMTRPAIQPQMVQQQQQEIDQLRELASTQAQQIQATQKQAQQILQEQQKQLAQITSQAQPMAPVTAPVSANEQSVIELKKTLNELKEAMTQNDATMDEFEDDEDSETLGSEIKSWIEST